MHFHLILIAQILALQLPMFLKIDKLLASDAHLLLQKGFILYPAMKIKIREQSLFARLAARKLKCKTVAAVLGNTIHLWNVSREDFLKRTPWVVHEVEHVRQFKRHGFLPFVCLYLWESARRGYHNNRYEVEARVAEDGEPNLEGVMFI